MNVRLAMTHVIQMPLVQTLLEVISVRAMRDSLEMALSVPVRAAGCIFSKACL